MATPRTLTQMQNRPTAWEVEIDGEVVAYIARKTKSALLDVARQNAKKIIAKLGEDDPIPVYTKGKWRFGPVCVKFTGRTERDAASAMGMI